MLEIIRCMCFRNVEIGTRVLCDASNVRVWATVVLIYPQELLTAKCWVIAAETKKGGIKEMMKSDCGNNIKSGKFTTWIYPDGTGYVEVAGDVPCGMPKKKTFRSLSEMNKFMSDTLSRLTNHQLKLDGYKYECTGCRTALKEEQIKLEFNDNDLLVGHCRKCNSVDLLPL